MTTIYTTQGALGQAYRTLAGAIAVEVFNREMNHFFRAYDDEILSLEERVSRLFEFRAALVHGDRDRQQQAFDQLPYAIRSEHGHVINTTSLATVDAQLAWLRGGSAERKGFEQLIEQLRDRGFLELSRARGLSLPPDRSDIDEAMWQAKVRFELFREERMRLQEVLKSQGGIVDHGYRFNNRNRVVLTGERGVDAHFAFERRYIQTSCPGRAVNGGLQIAPNDFWQMVQERSSSTIVMLNELYEAPDRFIMYWPNQIGTEEVYGEVRVKFVEQRIIPDQNNRERIVERRFEVSSPDRAPRKVAHFHYRGWNDGQGADVGMVSVLIDMIDPPAQQTGPVVIHCGAGMGRTGTFSLILRLAQELREQNGNTSLRIEHLLSIMRHPASGRGGGMVIEKQYLFCHEALRAYRDRLGYRVPIAQ